MESNGTLEFHNETEHEFARFLETGTVRAPGDSQGKTLKAWVDLAGKTRAGAAVIF